MTNQKAGRMKNEERDEKPNGDKKKSILYGMLFKKDWRRPTFPQINAVSSAMTGLTSLFGMGRGEHRRHRHPNVSTHRKRHIAQTTHKKGKTTATQKTTRTPAKKRAISKARL